MLGLMFITVIGSLVLLVVLAMWAAKRISLRAGQSAATARRWKYGVLAAVLLAIFWDWLPTWIAYEYYSRQAGLTVFKTLEQWKAENPGEAGALERYGVVPSDKRDDTLRLSDGRHRNLLNARLADDFERRNVFLSVRIWTHELVDVRKGEILARQTAVVSGNSGGLHAGGDGWFKFWLVHGDPSFTKGYREWSALRESAANLGGK